MTCSNVNLVGTGTHILGNENLGHWVEVLRLFDSISEFHLNSNHIRSIDNVIHEIPTHRVGGCDPDCGLFVGVV